MTRDWEAQLSRWARAPGLTEQSKMENAERAIRAAIDVSSALSARTISVFPQGSYRNRTTVMGDSDVDIGVVCEDVFFSDWSQWDASDHNPSPERIREFMRVNAVSDTPYTYAQFRNEVGEALVARFGAGAVKRGNKAFDIHENTYRVEADVVAAMANRLWTPVKASKFEAGIRFVADDGTQIINWPEQHYGNGVAKNARTGERFKAMARILKNLANEMKANGIPTAEPMASFLLESLAYNVADDQYGKATWLAETKNVIGWLWEKTKTLGECLSMMEVNERKWLFIGNSWKREDVNAWLYAAWNYDGLGKA